MSIRNLKDGSKKPWLCKCYPNGRRGMRVRKAFVTKLEAAAFEKFTMREVEANQWLADKLGHCRLSDVVQLWFELYNKTLANNPVIYGIW